MKKIIFALAIIALILGGAIFIRQRNNKPESSNSNSFQPIKVSIKTAEESKLFVQKIEYPAIVSGESEAMVNAKSSGTITAVNISIGNFVNAGQFLAKIDEIGANLSSGKNNFESSQIQTLELALKQAKENESLAKKNYKNGKSDTTKTAWDIAKLQTKSAEVALSGALDSRNIIAPISGRITEKYVSVGDSINIGQPLAKISNINSTKFQFYVDQEILPYIKIGYPVNIKEGEKIIPCRIKNISPIADDTTKRFLIEATANEKTTSLIGTILSAEIEITKKSSKGNSLILPISAITIGQNENYIFIVENDKAKKINVNILKISGETAEIEADLPSDSQIIISGNKLLGDQTPVETN
ncbi:MAG TPA: efflux RND transporter periplasmic adaptor subunit [Candidatus Moranbacteria bacterium]|nr:efflux RND transporter periplasmic adaptor subunit [Candidatus Moranbacteria bacterium]